MEWAKIIGVITGCALVIGPLIKWLIGDWFKKAKEIETLKAQQTKRLLDSFQKDINSLADKLRHHELKLEENRKTSHQIQSRMDSITVLLDESLKTAEFISKNMNQQVQQHVKTEVLKLKEHLIMIRNKGTQHGK